MTLSIYEPWRLMNHWQQDLDRALRGSEQTEEGNCDWRPAVDIREEENQYLLHADLPGVAAKDIDITMEDNVLTISGKRHSESTENKENYRRIERVSGMFLRQFTLPKDADAEHIKAKTDNGILEIVIPKVEARQARKIEVNE